MTSKALLYSVCTSCRGEVTSPIGPGSPLLSTVLGTPSGTESRGKTGRERHEERRVEWSGCRRERRVDDISTTTPYIPLQNTDTINSRQLFSSVAACRNNFGFSFLPLKKMKVSIPFNLSFSVSVPSCSTEFSTFRIRRIMPNRGAGRDVFHRYFVARKFRAKCNPMSIVQHELLLTRWMNPWTMKGGGSPSSWKKSWCRRDEEIPYPGQSPSPVSMLRVKPAAMWVP